MRRDLVVTAATAVALTSAVAVSAAVSPTLRDRLDATLGAPTAEGIDQRQKDYNEALYDEISQLEQRVQTLENAVRVPPTPSPPRVVLWSAGMESGALDEWASGLPQGGGEYNHGTGDSIASTEAAHTGTYGLRQTADASVPGSATRMFRWAETKAFTRTIHGAWYRFPALIASATPNNFFNLAQFKSVDSTNTANHPAWVLGVKTRNGANHLYLAEHDPATGAWIRDHDPPVEINLPAPGTWVWIEMQLHQSETMTGGVIVRSGTDRASLTTVLDVQNVRTKAAGHENMWSTNSYPGAGTTQGGSSNITVDVDDIEISAVAAGPAVDRVR
jgi:hypothetical protein